MPVYHANTPEGRRIKSVKLDGREVMGELFIKTANTDEGWLDVYETEVIDGKRKLKCTPWMPVGFHRHVREPIVTRRTGKVEVELGPEVAESAESEPTT
jgi:hypothetical protein